MEFTELIIQERKAVKEALEYIGYFDVAESKNTMQEWLALHLQEWAHCCIYYNRLRRGLRIR